MADNYLEKQYERYQARKAAWERERKYGKKKQSVHPRPLPPQDTDGTEKDGNNTPCITTGNDTPTDD